jgi:hypothetical protein
MIYYTASKFCYLLLSAAWADLRYFVLLISYLISRGLFSPEECKQIRLLQIVPLNKKPVTKKYRLSSGK